MAGPITGDGRRTQFSKGSVHARQEKVAHERSRMDDARRRYVIVLYYREHLEQESLREAARLIQEACECGELEFEDGPSYPTLSRWLKTAREAEERGEDLTVFHFLDDQPAGRPQKEIPEELEAFMHDEILQGVCDSVSELLRAVNKKAEALDLEPLSYHLVRRYLDEVPIPERYAAKYGRRAALIDAMPKSTLPTSRPHEMWMLDETTIPVYSREIDKDTNELIPVKLWLILLIDVFSRAILSFHLVPAFKYGRDGTYTSDEILGTFLGGAFPSLTHRVCKPFSGYLPDELRWDKHSTHRKLADKIRGIGIDVKKPVGNMPSRQGRIERINRFIKPLCADMKTYEGRVVPIHPSTMKEDPRATRRKAAASKYFRSDRRKPIPVEVLPTHEEVLEEFAAAVVEYNNHEHDLLQGLSPAQAYLRSRLDEAKPGVNGLLLMDNKVLTVTPAGLDHTHHGHREVFDPASTGETIDVGAELNCFADPLQRRLLVRFDDGRVRAMLTKEDWARVADHVTIVRDQQRRAAQASEHSNQLRRDALDEHFGPGTAELADEQLRQLLAQGEEDEGDENEEGLPPASAGLVARKRAEAARARRQGPREKFDEDGRRIMPAHLAGDPRQQIRRSS